MKKKKKKRGVQNGGERVRKVVHIRLQGSCVCIYVHTCLHNHWRNLKLKKRRVVGCGEIPGKINWSLSGKSIDVLVSREMAKWARAIELKQKQKRKKKEIKRITRDKCKESMSEKSLAQLGAQSKVLTATGN